MVDPSVFLTWTCPRRRTASQELKHIPVDVFDEILSWLRPTHDPDMTPALHRRILALLSRVCRYFKYYAIRELSNALDFDGGSPSNAGTPTGTWCTGILKRHEPMETFRKGIRSCTIHDWIPPKGSPQSSLAVYEAFLKLFPRVIPRLENIRSMNLCAMPIPRALFDSMGMLHHLEDLCIRKCYFQGPPTAERSSSTLRETSFPALSQLTIAECIGESVEPRLLTSFCTLASISTLKTLTLGDSWGFPALRSHLSSDLLSLNVHLSRDHISHFVAYLKTSTHLQDLTIFSPNYAYVSEGLIRSLHERRLVPEDREHFELKPEDLPSLRSFNGPLWLASVFVNARCVSRVKLYVSQGYVSLPPPTEHELGEPDSWYKPIVASPKIYDQVDFSMAMAGLCKSGIAISQFLSMPIGPSLRLGIVSKNLPNLLRLQVYFPVSFHGIVTRSIRDRDPVPVLNPHHYFFKTLGPDLRHLKRLESLHIYNNPRLDKLAYELSPGDQHNLINHWKYHCVSLSRVIFGSYMVWHWRRSASSGVTMDSGSSSHAHHQWELEILSPRCVRRVLEERVLSSEFKRVKDWGGKLESLLEDSPLKNEILEKPFPAAGPR